MVKQYVRDLADKYNFDKKELVGKINEMGLGFRVDNYMSMLEEDQIIRVEQQLQAERRQNSVEERLKKGVRRRRTKGERKRVVAAAEPVDTEVEAEAPSTNSGVVKRRKRAAVVARELSNATDEANKAALAAANASSAEDAAEKAEEARAQAETARRLAEETRQHQEKLEAEAEAAKLEAEARARADAEAREKVAAEQAAERARVEQEAAQATEAAKAAEAAVAAEAAEAAAEQAAQAAEAAEAAAMAQAGAEVDDAPTPPPSPDNGEGEQEAGPRPPRRVAGPGGAKILGRIDPALLKARLAAEGKNFGGARGGGSAAGGGGGRPSRRGGGPGGGRPVPGGGPGAGPGGPLPPPDGRNDRGRRKGGKKGGRRSVDTANFYDQNARIRRDYRRKQKGGKGSRAPVQVTQAAEHKRVIKVNEAIIISDLARQMGVKASEIIRKLMGMGEMYTINQAVDTETASLIAEEFNYTVESTAFDISEYIDTGEDTDDDMKPRPPVVTIMGHVDHGKTSLLDALRESNITSGESGGITQHIGAYQVNLNGRPITFLDTPGHAAFTALRARGAKATDIVILVVAADDGVMPQTIEAINHSKAAGVPIIVAVNKIDKDSADPERVKQALTEYELIPEAWGGETQFVSVSALHKLHLDELLEAVLLQSELLELKSNPARRAQGLVIESELDLGHGPVATVLVQAGTLKAGDYMVVGQHYGRVRTMFNERGEALEEAPPSTPVQVAGLSGVPDAGEAFFVVKDEKTARDVSSHAQDELRQKRLAQAAAQRRPTGLEGLAEALAAGQLKELKVIVKADVQGSCEAVVGTLSKLGNDEVRVKVIHQAVGGITENDVNLAATSEDGAIIVGFNVRPEARAQALAEEWGIELLTHSVIYDIEAVVKSALEGLLAPIVREEQLGRAEVRQTFNVPRVGTIAGCFVLDGKIVRSGRARVVRDGVVIYDSTINTLRRFKDDVREVKSGFECGLSVNNFNDIKVSDIIETYTIVEEAAKLE